MLSHSFRCFCLTACCGILVFSTGCSWLTPVKKPDIGPAGKPEYKTNAPLAERFQSPPPQLYDLEMKAGLIFDGINEKKWDLVQSDWLQLQSIWQHISPQLGDEKNVGKANESLSKLSTAIDGQKADRAYESLNGFMGSVGDIGQNFKLSPLSDIISISNKLRNVSFYVGKSEWGKAASRVKELEDSWGQAKPSMESIGILGEVTRTHSYIKQLVDAVNAENTGASESHIKALNDSIGSIRQFYRGK